MWFERRRLDSAGLENEPFWEGGGGGGCTFSRFMKIGEGLDQLNECSNCCDVIVQEECRLPG